MAKISDFFKNLFNSKEKNPKDVYRPQLRPIPKEEMLEIQVDTLKELGAHPDVIDAAEKAAQQSPMEQEETDLGLPEPIQPAPPTPIADTIYYNDVDASPPEESEEEDYKYEIIKSNSELGMINERLELCKTFLGSIQLTYDQENPMMKEGEKISLKVLNDDVFNLICNLQDTRDFLNDIADAYSLPDLFEEYGLEYDTEWSVDRNFNFLVKQFLSGKCRKLQ